MNTTTSPNLESTMNAYQETFRYEGEAAEQAVIKALHQIHRNPSSRSATRFIKVIQNQFTLAQVVYAARKTSLGYQRLRSARNRYALNYGVVVPASSSSHTFEFDWKDAPESSTDDLIDEVLGLDVIVSYKGWRIGIDVTSNGKPGNLETKVQDKEKLAHSYAALGVSPRQPIPESFGLDMAIILVIPTKTLITPDQLLAAIQGAIAERVGLEEEPKLPTVHIHRV